MKGQYKTKNGSKVEVLDFDEANKMVRISDGWVGEPEYIEWESLDEVITEEEISQEDSNDDTKEETVKKKPAKKK